MDPRTLRILSVAIAASFCLAGTAAAADLPPDLAQVPADAAAFVHVRCGDIYKSDSLKELRAMIARAGPEALRTFSERFVPDPTTLDRATLFFVMPSGGGRTMPIPSAVFRMSKPFDAAKLVKSIAPGGQSTRAGQKTIFVDRENDMAVLVLDDRTFQISPAEVMENLVTRPRPADGPLASALARAAQKSVFLAVNSAAAPDELRAMIPPPAVPIAKLKLATLAIDLGASIKIDLRLQYPDAESAGDAEQMIHTLIEMGKSAMVGGRAQLEVMLEGSGQPATLKDLPEATAALIGLGGIRQGEELVRALPLKREGADISLMIDVPPRLQTNAMAIAAVGAGLLMPAYQKMRVAAPRAQGQNNLKQMALAMHNYNDAYAGNLPAHAIYSKDGKTPLLSWRVSILPYIEQDNLYRQFHLDEPWDSEHNKKLIPLMPKVFVAPNAPPLREAGMTYYQVFVGGGAPWERSAKQPGLPRTFVDGTSNTIMIAEAGDAVPWTKPADLEFDPNKPLPRLGNRWNANGFHVALADGSVRLVSPKVSEKTLRAAITAAGNETLGEDW